VDAAVATALCLGVVNPFSSGIGGGAFITIYLANGTAEVINAREPAPAAANTTMYTGTHPAAADAANTLMWPLLSPAPP
jgi:gamma-glutamyltranspeptidase / glutathione hydrolase / leukotriene-C4 hydrolase